MKNRPTTEMRLCNLLCQQRCQPISLFLPTAIFVVDFMGIPGNRASHKSDGSQLLCESGVCATENCEFLSCCFK